MSKAPTRFGQRPNSEMGLRETAEEPLFLMRTRWQCPVQPQESYAAGVSCQSKTVENASKSPQTNLIDMRLNQNRDLTEVRRCMAFQPPLAMSWRIATVGNCSPCVSRLSFHMTILRLRSFGTVCK